MRYIFFAILFSASGAAVCFAEESFLENSSKLKQQEGYRLYDENTPEHVKRFYQCNHKHQTLDFVLRKKEEYLPLQRGQMDVREVVDLFDQLVDESDPDLDLPQRYHLFQTAEMLRQDGHPRWLILPVFLIIKRNMEFMSLDAVSTTCIYLGDMMNIFTRW